MTLPLTAAEESLVRLSKGYRCVELNDNRGSARYGRPCWGRLALRESAGRTYLFCHVCIRWINFALATDLPPSEELASAMREEFREAGQAFVQRVIEGKA